MGPERRLLPQARRPSDHSRAVAERAGGRAHGVSYRDGSSRQRARMAAARQCRDPKAPRRDCGDPARLRGPAPQQPRAARRLALGFVVIGEISARAQTLEPEGYRLDDYRAPTPETVPGGVVIDTQAAYKLWQAGGAIWGEFPPAPRRP